MMSRVAVSNLLLCPLTAWAALSCIAGVPRELPNTARQRGRPPWIDPLSSPVCCSLGSVVAGCARNPLVNADRLKGGPGWHAIPSVDLAPCAFLALACGHKL